MRCHCRKIKVYLSNICPILQKKKKIENNKEKKKNTEKTVENVLKGR